MLTVTAMEPLNIHEEIITGPGQALAVPLPSLHLPGVTLPSLSLNDGGLNPSRHELTLPGLRGCC